MSTTHQQATPTRDATDDQPAQRPPRYRGHRLDGPIQEFHHAVDALERDSVPYAYYLKVLAGRDQPPAERAPGRPGAVAMPPSSPPRGHHQGHQQPIDWRRLPAAPLVEAVRGHARRCQQPLDALMRPRLLQALQQAARVGQVTVLTGERICDEVLGWHPRMVWGEHYDQVICDPAPHRGAAPAGTTTAYRGGCRCLDCREANAARARTGRRAPAREGGERSA